MFPYILTYTASCVFLYIGLKCKSNKVLYRVLIGIALLLPALLAGLRDSSVGTDTKSYIQIFKNAVGLNNRTAFFENTGMEDGFNAFIYLISRLTNNVFWMLFLCELFACFFVWKAIDENVVEQYKVFAMLLYYLLFYSYSLNMIRQMMAMSILLFSYQYIKQRKLLKFLLCVIISFFFHKASVIGLVLYPIYSVCLQNDTIELQKEYGSRKSSLFKKIIYKYRYFLIALGILMACLIVYYAREIITFAHFYFDDYYQIYNGSGASTTRYMFYMVALLIVTAYTLQFKRTEFLYYFVIFIIGLILYQFRTVSEHTFRLSMFLSFYIIVLIPQVISLIKKKTDRAIVISMVLIIV